MGGGKDLLILKEFLVLQWNLDLTNYQGTEEMRSLNRGFVKSKSFI